MEGKNTGIRWGDRALPHPNSLGCGPTRVFVILYFLYLVVKYSCHQVALRQPYLDNPDGFPLDISYILKSCETRFITGYIHSR
jgi:hypothetical protein